MAPSNAVATAFVMDIGVSETTKMPAFRDRRTILSAISAAMQSVQGTLGKGAAPWLETRFGSDERTWRRRLTGASVPDGEASFALMLSPLGPRMLLAATEKLPPEEFEIFWNEMFDALAHARLARRQNKGPF